MAKNVNQGSGVKLIILAGTIRRGYCSRLNVQLLKGKGGIWVSTPAHQRLLKLKASPLSG